MKKRLFLLIVFGLLLPSAVHGQVVSALGDDNDPDDPIRVYRIHPMGQPSSALRYTLLPSFFENRPGNAAVYYGKVKAEQTAFFSNNELQNNIVDLIDTPLEQVKDSPHGPMACPDPIYQQLRNGALCEHCDWQIPIRHERFFEILLPELQQTRHFCRLLAARARYQIAHGQYEDAIETLQTGYALAKHNTTGPTYVHMLVAIACQTLMDEQLECLIQQPDAPNMYWALAALPKPLVSIRRAAEAEMSFIELSFPHLRDLSEEAISNRTPEFWHGQLVELLSSITYATSGNFDWDEANAEAELLVATLTMRGYPRARRLLVENGMDAEFVKDLTPSQAVLAAGIIEFHEQNQNLIKWSFVPYHQAAQGVRAASMEIRAIPGFEEDVLGLAAMVSPAVEQVLAVQARGQRQTAVLQTVEAIRLYAADNDGRLPGSYEDLRMYPVPNDPVTGEAMAIEFGDEQLSLTGPELPGNVLDVKIEIAE
ncbi:MAG: hypothetical protein AAF456_23855 [Planctomycetota bacterium]